MARVRGRAPGRGWELYEVEPADNCPDAVFVEDTAVVYGDLAVITRPGADQRKPETTGTEQALLGLGYRVLHIEPPGTLDGGDVLKHGGTVWVGLGGRTNRAGLNQLRAHLEPLGATVIEVPVTKVLHLKSAVTALPDGTVIGYDPLVDDPTAFPSYLSVPGGARGPRRPPRRLDRADVRLGPAHPGAARVPRSARRGGGHLRVPEARGLRDLPVDPVARLGPDGPRPGRWRPSSPGPPAR